MKTPDYSDQTKFFDPKTWVYPIHLIGAGGINNLVGPALAKMGIREIHIWDNDILETRNCPTEIAYSYDMVGQPKVAAMAHTIEYLMGENTVNVVQHQERVTEETSLDGIVISGVDSMNSRKIIWQTVQTNFYNIPLYIDGRSSGKHTAIFAFSPAVYDDTIKYQSWLFDDSKAMPLECGARNFPPVSLYVASEITRIVAQFHCEGTVQFYTKRQL